MQLQEDARTLYIGGAASYETVEDSLNYNLALVDQLIDSAPAPVTAPQPAVEQLIFKVPCDDVHAWIEADNATWSRFLETQPGFGQKFVLRYSASANETGVCHIVSYVEWESREIWKAIPGSQLAAVDAAFAEAYRRAGAKGPVPEPEAFPDPGGLSSHSVTPEPVVGPGPSRPAGEFLEVCRLEVRCEDVDRFFVIDNATFTAFLRQQPGFIEKRQLASPAPDPSGNCSMWSHTWWSSRATWHNVPVAGIMAAQARFVKALGYAPRLTRWPPGPNGLDVFSEAPINCLP